MWKFGSVESETERLRDPGGGQVETTGPAPSGRYAWRRVWEYWLALERHRPGAAFGRKVIGVPRLLDDPDTAEEAVEIRLADLLDDISTGDSEKDDVLRQAAVRAALNDSPWSAVFISYLMDQAGMREEQFHRTAAHWRYIRKAFEAPAGYAYAACDPRRTAPARGDLLCYGRGASAPTTFDAWREAVGRPGFSAAAHCDAVVDVDRDGGRMEVVGGNVQQSVARRELRLDDNRLLSDIHYRSESFSGAPHAACDSDPQCATPNLNLHYWSVLLRLQPGN